MKKHYVTFMSPGTFVAETTTKEIESWDVELAISMAENIKERYNAVPYGFYFTTRERLEEDFDSKQVAESNMYYLGGTVYTLKQIKDRNNPNDSTLIRNMEINKYKKVVENNNSWKWTQPLRDGDVVLKI